jgi:FixJ family two-component response regulator
MTSVVHVVDDDAALAESLELLLHSLGFEARRYATGGDFVSVCSVELTDTVLLDVMLPDTPGLELLSKVRQTAPAARVIMMTGYGDVAMAVDAMKRGAADFIEKPFTPEILKERLEAPPAAQSSETSAQIFQDLTPRELDVLLELTDGGSNKAIARELGLSPRTVEVHRRSILQKTGAKSSSHLLRLAVEAGMVKR